MDETRPKKMVSRNVAVALSLICFVLIALIAYFSVIDIQAQNSYNNLQNENKQLQANNTNLQNQVNALTSIVNLDNSTIWVNDQTINQGASSYNHWDFSTNYAGYVIVNIITSTTSNAYAEVICAANVAATLDTSVTVGYSGQAYFAVLPAVNVFIRVGNTNTVDNATETVTITYYY